MSVPSESIQRLTRSTAGQVNYDCNNFPGMNYPPLEIMRVSREVTTLKATKEIIIEGAASEALQQHIAVTERYLKEPAEAKQQNHPALKDANYALYNQAVLHNGVNLTHKEAIHRIFIRIMDLDKCDSALVPVKKGSERAHEDVEGVLRNQFAKNRSRRSRKRRTMNTSFHKDKG